MISFKESNRDKHFYLAIPVGLILTILGAIGVAIGLEFKDCHYANGSAPLRDWNWSSWDWKDFMWTVLGGLVGQSIQVGVIVLLIWVI